jgi:phosphoribosylamine--glycine ligase
VKVLVIGSGGREHALVRHLRRDPLVTQVLCAPGNPGIAALASCLPLTGAGAELEALVAVAQEHAPDLVVIGPEAPLVAGAADALRAQGLAVFGPSQAAARLEGSKAFAKEVMHAAGVPTAGAAVCTTLAEVSEAMASFGAPYVIKDDGLAAGKGVVVTNDAAAALAHAEVCLSKPEGAVVVEEFLDGPEVSLFCVCDGTTVVPLAPAQDFKRIYDGDEGPNTGGMGAYSPLTWAPESLVDEVVSTVAIPTLGEMARRGTPFVGLLFIGLALTSRGPRVIEFNVRFGDPETLVVLERLGSPLGALLAAAASGNLADQPPLTWSADHAVVVVVAAQDYPGTPRTGDPIEGVDEVDLPAFVYHAGTSTGPDGELLSAGGRVLSVLGRGESLAGARTNAYAAVDRIRLRGSQVRRDIAATVPELG